MSRARHRARHWDYRDGHNVALHPEEPGPGAGTRADDAHGEEGRTPADCTRGRGVLTGAPLPWEVRKGWVTTLRGAKDEQVLVSWNLTNVNTVDALSSPMK